MDAAEIGMRIAELRATRGYTVRQLAALLGWPFGTLANYETGRRPLTLDRLEQIADALDYPLAAFVVRDPTSAQIVAYLAAYPERAADIAFFLTTLDDALPEAP